jgi:AcrR family transcriptional regulator
MKKSSSTRDRILRSGANLLSQSGFSGVTLGALAGETGMSKSGLFAHFRSKEDVQTALLEGTGALLKQCVIAPAMKARKGLPRLKALVEGWLGCRPGRAWRAGAQWRRECSNSMTARVPCGNIC